MSLLAKTVVMITLSLLTLLSESEAKMGFDIEPKWIVDNVGMGWSTRYVRQTPKLKDDWYLQTRANYRWERVSELMYGSFSGLDFDCGKNLTWYAERGLTAELSIGWKF